MEPNWDIANLMENQMILPYPPLQGECGRRDNAELVSEEKELRLGDAFSQ